MHRLYLSMFIVVAVNGRKNIVDLLYIALIIGFFAGSAGLIRFCAALMEKGGRS